MGETSIKTRLLQLIEEARSKEITFWFALSESERSAIGEADHWAAKDVLAHIAFWNDNQAKRLEAAILNEIPQAIEDYENTNQEVFRENRELSWETLLLKDEQAFDRLKAAFSALHEEMLDDPQLLEWTNARPLWWEVGFTAYYHVLDHLCYLHIERGEKEKARSLHEDIAKRMMSLSEAESWKGTTIYNLACFYALNEYSNLALDRLRKAFVLNPDLKEWSRKDSDLDKLHQMPDFQALFDD
jgi:hypothetical protein